MNEIDLIQVSGDNVPNKIKDLIIKANPDIVLYSNNENNVFSNIKNIFTKLDKEKVVEIW